MTDPTLARIEDELQAMRSEMATRGDVARLMAAVERIAAAPSFTADDDDAPAEPRPARVDYPHLVWIPDPDSASECWGEVVMRVPRETPPDEDDADEPKYTRDGRAYCPDCGIYLDLPPHFSDCKWGGRDADEDAPVEPPRDMAASIARGLAQAAAGQVIELDPDEYRPCTEGRGGEAWPE